jgi:hypothetical protein
VAVLRWGAIGLYAPEFTHNEHLHLPRGYSMNKVVNSSLDLDPASGPRMVRRTMSSSYWINSINLIQLAVSDVPEHA